MQPTISKPSGLSQDWINSVWRDCRGIPRKTRAHWEFDDILGAGIYERCERSESVSGDHLYRDLQTMTVEAQLHSLTEYCDEYPMANFSKAVIDLYRKLPLKKYTPPASTSQ
jgi:hypothetical protein